LDPAGWSLSWGQGSLRWAGPLWRYRGLASGSAICCVALTLARGGRLASCIPCWGSRSSSAQVATLESKDAGTGDILEWKRPQAPAQPRQLDVGFFVRHHCFGPSRHGSRVVDGSLHLNCDSAILPVHPSLISSLPDFPFLCSAWIAAGCQAHLFPYIRLANAK
jgi:hypothetical protein